MHTGRKIPRTLTYLALDIVSLTDLSMVERGTMQQDIALRAPIQSFFKVCGGIPAFIIQESFAEVHWENVVGSIQPANEYPTVTPLRECDARINKSSFTRMTQAGPPKENIPATPH